MPRGNCPICYNSVPQTRWLQQQKPTLVQLCRPEVKDQDVSKVGFFGGPFPWLIDSLLLRLYPENKGLGLSSVDFLLKYSQHLRSPLMSPPDHQPLRPSSILTSITSIGFCLFFEFCMHETSVYSSVSG